MEIEFADLTVKLQTKEYFEEGSGQVKIERTILEMSDPAAEVELNEYMVACYGTTEYPEDMTGILLTCEGAGGAGNKSIVYEYKCREESMENAAAVTAVVQPIETKVSMTQTGGGMGYIREGYAFSPMFTLGYKKKVTDKEVYATWLRLEKAN